MVQDVIITNDSSWKKDSYEKLLKHIHIYVCVFEDHEGIWLIIFHEHQYKDSFFLYTQ